MEYQIPVTTTSPITNQFFPSSTTKSILNQILNPMSYKKNFLIFDTQYFKIDGLN